MPNDGGGRGTESGRRTFLKATGAAGAAGLTGLAGCTGGTGGASGTDELRVGVITSQSGSYSFLGQGEIQGAELAKADLESEFDTSIEIVTADTETDPATGLERMQRLVNEDGIDFALGGVSSSVAIKMGNWASDNGVAYMAAGSHSDATTGESCAEHMFRPTTSNSMLANSVGQGMAEFADSWYIMYADYTWGQTGRAAVVDALESNGASVVGEVATPFPSDDYTQYLNEVQNSDADGMAVVIAGTDQRIVTKQFLDKGMGENFKMAGPLFEEAVFWGLGKEAASIAGLWATPWAASVPSSDLGEELKTRVADEYDASPFSRHYMGYTSMDQLARAALRADSVAAADITAELEGHQLEHSLKQGDCYFRAEDHQLVQPVDTVQAMSVDQMQDDPYRSWTDHVNSFPGDSVARSASETGCEL